MLGSLRYSVRRVTRRPVLASGITLLLACPIAASLLAMAFLNGVVVRPLPFPLPEQLVGLSLVSPDGTALGFTGPDFSAWQEQVRSLSGIAAYDEGAAIVQTGELTERVDGVEASSNLVDVLAVRPLVGRFFTQDEDRVGGAPVVVIGHALWQRAFGGDRSVIGRSIRVGGVNRQVIGVMGPGFAFPRTSEYWTPIRQDATLADRSNFDMTVIGRIRSGHSFDGVASELRLVTPRLVTANGDRAGYSTSLRPLRSLLIGRDLGRMALAISLAAILLVSLAGVSVAGLLVADALGRRREMSIRAALGARRAALVAPFAAEALVYWGIAAMIAVMLSSAASGLVARGLPRPIAVLFLSGWDWRVLALGVGVCLAFSLVLGVGSGVWLMTRAHASPGLPTMRGDAHSTSRSGFRDGPVFIAAVATSLLLVLGLNALSYVRRITTTSLGFSPGAVSAATYQILGDAFDQRERRVALAAEALRLAAAALPVANVAGATRVPGMGVPLTAAVERREQTGALTVHFAAITQGFFETLAIQVRRGRDFDQAEHSASAPRVAIVSRSLASRLWPNTDAMGQSIRIGIVGAPPPVPAQAVELRVIGIADDVRDSGYEGALAFTVYTPLSFFPAYYLTVITRDGPNAVADPDGLQAALRPLGADVAVFRAIRLREAMSDAMWMPIAVSRGLNIIAVSALIIAFGSIGTAVYFRSLTMRHELAIRMAVGASPHRVLAHLAGRPATLTAVGTLIGLVGGSAATGLLPITANTTSVAAVALVVAVIVSISAACAIAFPAARVLRGGFRDLIREE